MILETERLYLREMTENDLENLSTLLKDKRVMYAYEHDFDMDDIKEWLYRQMRRYQKDNFGLWAIILKETKEFIGQGGLTLQKCEGEEVLEIGYLLKYDYWHKGYALETVKGCKKYAFDNLKAESVYSIIKHDNISSQRVAENLGMTKVKEFITQYYNGDILHYLYRMENKKDK